MKELSQNFARTQHDITYYDGTLLEGVNISDQVCYSYSSVPKQFKYFMLVVCIDFL